MNVSAVTNPGAPPRVFGIVGHPVDHSLSPSIHNPLFAELGLNAVYIAIPVDPTHADRIADLIRDKNLAGVNLTVPFKERVLPLLDEVSGAARRAGAVNVVVNTNGRLAGHNTDGEGFIRALLAEGGPTRFYRGFMLKTGFVALNGAIFNAVYVGVRTVLRSYE